MARTVKEAIAVVTICGTFIYLLFSALSSWDPDAPRKERAIADWNEPCHDESMLVATTAGSPNGLKCPNRLHRMQVQVTTTPSKEEIGALVFCQCIAETGDR